MCCQHIQFVVITKQLAVPSAYEGGLVKAKKIHQTGRKQMLSACQKATPNQPSDRSRTRLPSNLGDVASKIGCDSFKSNKL
jgi:hypothetical protein